VRRAPIEERATVPSADRAPRGRVVSITPVSVQADSRTFKQAASIARFGYESVVVEGEPSTVAASSLPFGLVSLSGGRPPTEMLPAAGPGRRALRSIVGFVGRAFRGLPRSWGDRLVLPVYAVDFVRSYARAYFVNPIRHIPPASLYILHSFQHFPAVYWLARKHHVPFIYDAHDFYSHLDQAGARTGMERVVYDPFYRWIERRCMRAATAVTTVSGGVSRLQQAAFGRAGIVLRNSHDPRLSREPRQHLRERLNLTDDDFLLVTVGQAKPGQAISEALEALAMLPEHVHLALVGRGYAQRLEDYASHPIRRRVHAVAPVDSDQVVTFIRTADASLVLYYGRSPNYEHCLPNGFFQSIAAGLPVLYPRLPELARLADEHGFGLAIDPRTPVSIRDAVTTLLDDPTRLAALRARAVAAGAALSWEREEEVLCALVARLLAPAGTAPRDS
jgi:glycosyltransferase involved in cell wall biosynthesis